MSTSPNFGRDAAEVIAAAIALLTAIATIIRHHVAQRRRRTDHNLKHHTSNKNRL